jgi:hypothetical protein
MISLNPFKKKVERTRYVHLNSGLNFSDFQDAHPNLLLMLAWINRFCWANSIKCVVSSIFREYDDGISESNTHQTGRAFDLSLKPEHGWTDELIVKMEQRAFKELDSIGAISLRTKLVTPVFIHENKNKNQKVTGLHAHFQVRPIKPGA